MEWICVKERLPETFLKNKKLKDGRIIIDSDKSIPILFLLKDDSLKLTGWFSKDEYDGIPKFRTYSCGCCYKESYDIDEVSHWMPLPSAPHNATKGISE